MGFCKFGLRQYQPEGDKEDEMGKYFGLSSVCDLQCAPNSIRIQKVHSMTQAYDEATAPCWKPKGVSGTQNVPIYNRFNEK